MGFIKSAKQLGLTISANKAIEKNDFVKGIELYTQLIELGSENNESHSTKYAIRSDLYRKIDDYESALDDLDTAIELTPHNDSILIRRAQVLHILGETEEAIDDISEALEINPKNSNARELLNFLQNSLDE